METSLPPTNTQNIRRKMPRPDSRSGRANSPKAPRIDGGRFYNYRGFILLVFAALTIWLNLTFIVPIVMGVIFATVLYPLMGKLKGWKVSDTWKATVITIAFVICFLAPLSALILAGADAALEQIQRLQSADLSASQFSFTRIVDMFGLRPIMDRVSDISPISEAQIRQYGTRALVSFGGIVAGALQNFFTTLPGAMFAVIVILFTIFFLLIDGPRAADFIRKNSIFGARQTDILIHSVQALCYSVLVATIVSGAVQSAIIGLACLITGTSGVVLIVLISFLASFFPLLGTAPVTVFLTAQAFLSGNTTAGFIFLASIPIVGVSDNIVRPYVLKGGAELHPLIGFVSAFGALDMIGFYGLFIGPVVTGFFFAILPMITKSYPQPTKHTVPQTSMP